MLLSINWLKQYLPEGINLSDEELQERVNVSLTEVETIHKIGDKFDKIVVGEIKKIETHPRSSNLSIVIVNISKDTLRNIVCGAKNIYEGAKVPVVLPGGVILNPKQELGEQEPIRIKEVEISGTKSEGMLASQKELGISEEHEGIWILSDDLKVGDDFVNLIKDIVLEIENKSLTHRPDCFSHVGIARELSAILKIPFKYEESGEPLAPTQKLPLKVTVEDKNLCKRYTAIAIKGIKVGPSPFWLQNSLLAIGIRPVNNIVDATNYVMSDVGQPLHAFDYHKLKSPKIIVRTAKPGEKTVTLDDKEHKLTKSNLLICDTKGPIGIAGVMGSKNSEIDKSSKDIVIESANFEMFNIRRTARELGIRSEASIRFEKGLDPNLTLEGLKRVVQIILEIAGGEVACEVTDIYPEVIKENKIEFDTSDVPRLLGIDLSKEEILDILRSLQLEIKDPEASATQFTVIAPTFRRDLNIKEDILEEIARLYGYDKFKPTLPARDLKPGKLNPRRELEKKTKLTLSALGFDEIYTYSFTGEEQYMKTLLNTRDCIRLKNPISAELGYMRTSMVPSHLEKLYQNSANFNEILFYEISRVYFKKKGEEGLPQQPKIVTGLICKDIPNEELFFELKGKIEKLLEVTNVKKVRFEKSKNKVFLNQSQQAIIKTDNLTLGFIGTIQPQVKNNWEITKKNVSVFELNLEEISKNYKEEKEYTKISKFPQVRRDLSFWIDRKVEAGKVLQNLRSTKTKYITEIRIIDVFEGPKDKARKSIAVQLTLQSYEKTLREKDINADVKSIIIAIGKLGGEVRKAAISQ